jgi:DNA-binding MarR family transcriptional regulator
MTPRRLEDSSAIRDEDDLFHRWGAVVHAFERVNAIAFGAVEAETGLSRSSFELLARLLQEPDYTAPMSYLARHLIFSTGGMTKLADRLAEGGLISRETSLTDRRVVNAVLTPAGVKAVRRGRELFVRALRTTVVETLGHQKFDQLVEILSPLAVKPDKC